MFICEVTIYIYEMERQERLNVCPNCQIRILADVPRQTFFFSTGVVTFSFLCRFSEFFRAGYIVNVRHRFFLFFLTHQFLTMFNKQHKNRFFAVKFIAKKSFLLYFFVLAAKQLILNILKNRALQHQTVIFVYVTCALVGFVIYLFQNLFVNNDCVFVFLFLIVLMKRIEKTKNRVKSDLETAIKIIDSKM